MSQQSSSQGEISKLTLPALYQPRSEAELLLVTVEHCGTRYVRSHLIAWGVDNLQLHVDNERLQDHWGTQPAIVAIRDPVMCFLSWWKRGGNGHDEDILASRFLSQWRLLDTLLESCPKEFAPIIFKVDCHQIRDLATALEVEFKPPEEVDKVRAAHYITDEWVEPRRKRFHPDILDLARRWGYQ